ncbi:MAG: glutamate--cysteine ligase [Bacteroidetes bacterium]|nr:glutamate--cysteine ligase [Bacteroidota bacterium]
MSEQKTYGLFEVAGIELEYMVVDRETLRASPTVDLLFKDVTGHITGDVERGDVDWSNELTAHVLEMKTAKPTADMAGFAEKFSGEVRAINALLAKRGLMLLPTAAHPLFDPFTETVLWTHEYNEVYALYNKIFDCRGHGWSNLQSVHLNLPFANDAEFGKLHTAIRLLLPLIPALSASSPILDGKPTGHLDARMEAYLHHQEKLPALMGSLIPEAVLTEEEYYREIFSPIGKALAPYDPEGIMDHEFANSRGAIARFDRGAIEIRVVDIQECPQADIAIAQLLVETLKALVDGRWASQYVQRAWHHKDLLKIFLKVIKKAGGARIRNHDYLLMFGLDKPEATAQELWEHLFAEVGGGLGKEAKACIKHILVHGCLAKRILARTGPKPDAPRIIAVYKELAQCLQEGRQLA